MRNQPTNQYRNEYYVKGMHCAACELYVENAISKIPGISKADADLKSGKLQICGERNFTTEELSKVIEENGYKIVANQPTYTRTNWNELLKGLLIASVFMMLFYIIQKLDIVNLGNPNESIGLPFVFMVGIVASISTCMAVVGGLVLTLSSHFAGKGQTKPLVLFHLSRIIGFFILGGVIGLIGSAFTLSPALSFVINLVLFATMILLAINMLGVFPGLQGLQFKMPKFVGKKVVKMGDTPSLLMPIFLGAATFFLPCGFTQSMQLYSLTTGSFINGALTMLVFALGTFPMLALISFVSTKFSKTLQSGLFYKTAGFIVIFFAVFNLVSSLYVIGML